MYCTFGNTSWLHAAAGHNSVATARTISLFMGKSFLICCTRTARLARHAHRLRACQAGEVVGEAVVAGGGLVRPGSPTRGARSSLCPPRSVPTIGIRVGAMTG